MLNIFLNRWLLLPTWVLFSSASIFCSLKTNDFGVFSSSGSVAILMGIFLSFKHSLFTYSGKSLHQIHNEKSNVLRFAEKTLQEKDKLKVKNIIHDEITGAILMTIGTLISAYGLYLPNLLKLFV